MPRRIEMVYQRIYIIVLLSAMSLIIVPLLQGQELPDSTTLSALRLRKAIIFTGSLNADCYADTVIGYPDVKFNYLPYAIMWGKPGPREDSLSAARCMADIPRERRVAVTYLRYPEWHSFSGSVTFQPVNQDSLDDITLFIWGKVGEGSAQRDTIRPVVIFAQPGLDTLPAIDVADITAFQTSPFFAMDLRLASELVHPSVRDISGRTSYELQQVTLDIELADSILPPPISIISPGPTSGIRAYPNPTAAATQIQGISIPAGEYLIEVVSSNGEVHLQQRASVPTSGELLRMIDLTRIASGLYLIRLRRDETIIGTYPIVITR